MLNYNQPYAKFIEQADGEYLRHQIYMHGHNQTALAKKMGIGRATLHKKLNDSHLHIKEMGTINE